MMTRTSKLQPLLALREARSQRAETALARQNAQCETARAQVEAATARVTAHKSLQQARERELLDELLGQTVTIGRINRVRDAFAALDDQAAILDRSEREASQAMHSALELKAALMADRNQRRREQDKMSALVVRYRQAALKRRELLDEVEQEERVRSTVAERR